MNTLMLDTGHIHSHSGFDLMHIISETLIDALKILPLLFLAYLVIEIIEHKAANKLRGILSSRYAGVVGGAALGLFPECGFSVAASNLYAERLISAGTLAAVFIATSDEALPIILSIPETAKYFLPLFAVKFVLAVIAGFLLDFILRTVRSRRGEAHGEHEHEHEHDGHGHGHSKSHFHEAGEHHRCTFCDSNRGILKNSLIRTLLTLAFVVVTIFVFNTVVSLIGEDTLERVMSTYKYLQPFLTALIGLVPSCAVSVMLAGLFAKGAITFGALTAGLCAGAGAGIAVLLRSCKRVKGSLSIIGYVWLFSAVAGVVISIFI